MTDKTWRQQLAENDKLDINVGVVRAVIKYAESIKELEECREDNERLRKRVVELDVSDADDDRMEPVNHHTPVYHTSVEVDHTDYENDDVEEHYSLVFHRDHPRRIVARFQGQNHKADAQAYCDWCQTRNGS